MAKYSNSVSYHIQTTLDASGLTQLQAQIRQAEAELKKLASQDIISEKAASEAQAKIRKLQNALNNAFNSNIGMLDMAKFQKELGSGISSIQDLRSAFALAGTTGEKAFIGTLGRLGQLDTGIQSISKTTDKMMNTLGNTVRWGIVASGFAQIMNSAHQAVQYVRDLDESLTNIMMVTGQSREQMNAYAQTANEVAKALSSTTVAMTDATLVFAQQGFDTETSTQLAQRSTQLANISQQDTATTSDQITTMMNAYNFSGDLEAIDAAMDSWAQVANDSASDVQELATASQKAASTAYTVGLTMDQLNAQIATIESVTREAPENIGNALKTIYSRFADISLGETLEDGVDLGTIAQTLGKVGVNVLNDAGELRGVGDIMEDLMGVWDTMDSTDQSAISTVIAGRYQLSRFQALMNRSDLYNQYLESSLTAEGTADEMQQIFDESMQGRINQLQATVEGVFNNFFETSDFYGMIDALTQLVELMNEFVDAVGGGANALTGLGSIATKVFSNSIAGGINNFLNNRERQKTGSDNIQQAKDFVSTMGYNPNSDFGASTDMVNFIADSLQYASSMSEEEQSQYNSRVQQTIELKQKQVALEQEVLKTVTAINLAYGNSNPGEAPLFTTERNEGTGYSLNVNSDEFYRQITQSGLDTSALVENFKGLFSSEEGSPLAQDLSNALRPLQETTSSLISSLTQTKDVSKLSDIFGEAANKARTYGANIANLTKKFDEQTPFVQELSTRYKNYKQALDDVRSGAEKNTDVLMSAASELNNYMGILQDITRMTPEEFATRVENYEKDSGKMIGAQEGSFAQDRGNKGFTSGLERKSQIDSVVEATAAIGQLAFSWQSFQSLGSLWANSDIELGEKLSQTVMNLSVNLPMLVSSLADLNQVAQSGGFKDFADRISQSGSNKLEMADQISATIIPLREMEKGNRAAGVAARGNAVAQRALGAASKGAAVAVRGLGAALSFLGGPAGIILTVGLMAASAIIENLKTQSEEAYNAAKQQAEDAASNYQSISDSVTNFNSLYEEYKQTGTASEEFISAAQDLSETLDIQGGSALIASENFDALAASIASADKAQREAAKTKIDAFLEGSGKEALTGGLFKNGQLLDGSSFSDLMDAMAYNSQGKAYQDGLYWDDDAWSEAVKNEDFGAAAGIAQSLIEDIENRIQEIDQEIANASTAGQDTSELEEAKSNYLGRIDRINSVLEDAENQAYLSSLQQKAELNAQDLSFSDDMSYQDIVNQFFDSSNGMLDYLSYLHNWSDQLSWMIANTTDETAKLKLQLQQAYETSGQDLQGRITSELQAYNIDSNQFISGELPEGADTDTLYAQEMTKSLQDQIKNSGLTESEQLEFIAGLDINQSLAEIQKDISEINISGQLPKLAFEPELTDRSDFSEEEISELLSDTGMTESGFQRMSSATFENEEFQNSAQEIEDEIKALEESGDASEETQDKIKELRQEYEDLGDTAEDVSAYNLQMSKGVEALVENWEELGEVLQDDASEGTADYYKALGELDEIMSDILNIDTGVLSDDFYKNADAIEAMGRAAEGDMSAIDDLRNLASEDIVAHLDVQAITPEDKAYLINNELLPMLADFQAQIDSMPLGAKVDVDTQPFIMKLNQLLEAGQITAAQATNILSSIGMDAEIGKKTQTVTQQYTAYFPKFTVEKDENGVMTGLVPAGVTPIDYEATETVEMPYIQGATYTGSGISTVGGASSGRLPSSGGGGGRGGGGGGSGKTYEPKEKDPIEEEIDRYERVNTMLQAVENDFDRIAEEQDRLVGFDQADNMNEQIELLQRQIALHKEKLAIQKDEAKELRDELSSQYGVTFDSEGFIKNYASTHQKLINRVNNLIDQYNAATTESAQEKLEEQIEKAQDRLDDFNETYQRYDELWSGDLKDTLKSLEDLEDQIEDIRIEAFQTSIEAADNIKDVQTALNEFNQVFSGLDSDDPFRQMALSVSNLKNYFDVATNSVDEFYDELIARTQEQLDMDDLSDSRRKYLEQQIAMMKEAQKTYGNQTMEEYGTGYLDMTILNLENMLAQIKQWEETGTSSIFGEDSGDMFEVAQDVFDQATSMIEDYEGEIDDLRDAILDAIDEIADEMERRVEAYEAITDELEHQNDIIELLRGENAYEEINKVLAAQQNNYQAQISEMQQQLDIWKDMQEAMEEGSEEWLAIQENITDTQQELNDLVQESLENLQEQYENTVNSITDSWVENAVGTDLDWMSEQWELINRNADYYLDDVNAAYETQKLQGKYLELLDQSNDLHVQQMITEQMKQQLGYLRDKEKLSEYDVAYANAQLEILQKRIALEEAQRNKSQMKLRRDSQGNYSYVYTADEGDVAAAEGDLLDAENNAYNLSKEQMKQTQDDSLSALTDAQQLINDIWTNANLTLEEKKERTQTIIDSLKEYLAGTSEQLSTSETNIINDFIGMVEMMTDENAERLDDVYQQIINGNLDAFDQIDTRWSTSLTEWLYNMEEFNNSTDGMFEGLIDNATDYQDQIDEVGDLVEQDFNDMADSIQNAVDKTNDLSSSTSDFINQLKNDAGVVKDYENTLQEYADKISDVTNEMRAYQDQVNELADKLTAKEQENANLTAQVGQLKDQIDAYENGGSGSGSGGGNAQGLKDVKAGSVVGFTGMYYYDSYGQRPAGNQFEGKKRAVKVSNFSASPYGNNSEAPNYGNYKIHIETKSGGHLGWVKPSQLLFDTGGYTGAWSGSGNQDAKDGKLAFLHQKELVLNANDTKNILAAVDIVREITQQMKSGLLGGILSSMSGAGRASQNNATQDIQQEVHITAEFPNANNASEIEQAILSLNERAVQYSFRR